MNRHVRTIRTEQHGRAGADPMIARNNRHPKTRSVNAGNRACRALYAVPPLSAYISIVFPYFTRQR